MRIRLLLLVLALASCAGGEDLDAGPVSDGAEAADASLDATPTPTCLITLNGALTGTIPCTATAGKRSSDDFSIVGALTSAASGGIAQVLFSIQLGGAIAVRDYEPADVRNVAVMASGTDNMTYAASFGSGANSGTIGTLHITALELLSSDDPSTTIWTPHGTFSATLAGLSTTGTVTLTATF